MALIPAQAAVLIQALEAAHTLVQVVGRTQALVVVHIPVQAVGPIPAPEVARTPVQVVELTQVQVVPAIRGRVVRLTTNGTAHLRIANRQVDVAPNKRFERDAAKRRAPQAKR